MNIIDLETPTSTEKYSAPKTTDEYPFYVTEFGKTYNGTPCYQLRPSSPFSCLQYVISGSGVIIYLGRLYTVKAGDTFMLLEGRDQVYYSNPDNNFERIWINFKGELSLSLIDIYKIGGIPVFPNLNTLPLLEEMHSVCLANSDPEIYKNESSRVFLKLIQFLSSNSKELPAISDTVEEIRLYLDKNIDSNIKLSQVAKHFSFSPEHLIRVFKNTYGITPHQYLLESRIRIAMIMLKSSGESISRISEKLNFSDPRHFSHVFKKHIGWTPSEYRNKYRS